MFAGYTAYGLDVLLERGVVAELAKGDTLYKEGEDADFVALVISGLIELYVDSEGQEQTLPAAGPSRLLGELAVLAGANRVM
jgi:CRP-like cAMP-binding protein